MAYNTKQRSLVLDFLSRHADVHLTAEDISEGLRSEGAPVGTATVYRQLDRLTRQGEVIKFASAAGHSACYQYLDKGSECRTHYHLKCSQCGQLIHCDCSLLDELSRHIRSEHDFAIDPGATVLFGSCEMCQKKMAETSSRKESKAQ